MNKDIPKPVVKNVTVVIKPGATDEHWSVYLVNFNPFPIKNIIVASEGYGKKEANREKTSVIRQYFEELPGESSLQIELIDPKVFHLFNEYGVTYYIDSEIYFKKFVFVPDSILSENLIYNTILEDKVVTHS
jgi:hypothetical protein